MISFNEWKKLQESRSTKKGKIMDTLLKIKGAQRANTDFQAQPRAQTFEMPGKNPQKERKNWKAKLNK